MRRTEPGRGPRSSPLKTRTVRKESRSRSKRNAARPRPGAAEPAGPSRCRSSSRATRPLATISFSRVPSPSSAAAPADARAPENARRQIPSIDRPAREGGRPAKSLPSLLLLSFPGSTAARLQGTSRPKRTGAGARLAARGLSPCTRPSRGRIHARRILVPPMKTGCGSQDVKTRRTVPLPVPRESPGPGRRHPPVEGQPLAGRGPHRAEPADDRPRRPVALHGPDGLAHRAFRDHVHAPERVHQRRVHLLHPGASWRRSSSGASSAAGAATSWPSRTSAPG